MLAVAVNSLFSASERILSSLPSPPDNVIKGWKKALLRLNEALSAKWSKIDIESRVWVIPARNSKSKRVRSVPLNQSALDVLAQLGTENHDYLFISHRSGTHLKEIHSGWKTLREKAELPHLRIHDLRHSFASFLVNSGRTLYEVQKILGHSVPTVRSAIPILALKHYCRQLMLLQTVLVLQ